MKKHKHAELILQYAQDAMETDKPWERWEHRHGNGNGNGNGNDTENPWFTPTVELGFSPSVEYRRKPVYLTINGFYVPKPEKAPLQDGTEYYVPSFNNEEGITVFLWRDSAADLRRLRHGVVHLKTEDAYTHTKALRSFTQAK